MLEAVRAKKVLKAPTVGTWHPQVGRGAPLSPGMVLGHLRRVGRAVAVVAPEGASGIALKVAPAGTWVEYGALLVQTGEAALGESDDERPPTDEAEAPPGVKVVRAETDGTIYLRPEPSALDFAPQGAAITAHETVALIEVMKTFTPVRSPFAGTVERVLVGDAVAVSAGDPLLWVAVAE